MVEAGVGEIPWLLFCPFLKYFTRYVLQIYYVDENHHFLTFSAKNPIFLRFVSEKLIFANFHVHFQCIQISEGALTLWRHSDVIWSSMVLILVSMDRGGPYLYTGSKYMGIAGIPYSKSREGVATIPLRRTCYKRYVRRTRVKRFITLWWLTPGGLTLSIHCTYLSTTLFYSTERWVYEVGFIPVGFIHTKSFNIYDRF